MGARLGGFEAVTCEDDLVGSLVVRKCVDWTACRRRCFSVEGEMKLDKIISELITVPD